MTYQEDQLVAELVFLGSRVHWSLGEVLDLDHLLRRRVIAELTQAELDDDE